MDFAERGSRELGMWAPPESAIDVGARGPSRVPCGSGSPVQRVGHLVADLMWCAFPGGGARRW